MSPSCTCHGVFLCSSNPWEVDVTCSSPFYPFVGGSTSMGMSLSVLPLRDVVARTHLECVSLYAACRMGSTVTWISGTVVGFGYVAFSFSLNMTVFVLFELGFFVLFSLRDAPLWTLVGGKKRNLGQCDFYMPSSHIGILAVFWLSMGFFLLLIFSLSVIQY